MENLKIKIRLKLYSGIKDPSWVFNATEIMENSDLKILLEIITNPRFFFNPENEDFCPPNTLGYKGILIKILGNTQLSIYSQEILIFGRKISFYSQLENRYIAYEIDPIVEPSLIGLVLYRYNFNTLQPYDLSYIDKILSKRASYRPNVSLPDLTICPNSPKYSFKFWTLNKRIKNKNNCYNYAVNKRTDSFAKPGRAAGYPISAGDICETLEGCLKDGLVEYNPRVSGDMIECVKGGKLIALFIDPEDDFHFMRQDSNGFWSQKDNDDAVTNVDNEGAPIKNPSSAATGTYEFTTFLFIGKIRIKVE